MKVGLPRAHFHDLRHSAASPLIAAELELVEVSMLLGHSELRVTADLYTHVVKHCSGKGPRPGRYPKPPPLRSRTYLTA